MRLWAGSAAETRRSMTGLGAIRRQQRSTAWILFNVSTESVHLPLAEKVVREGRLGAAGVGRAERCGTNGALVLLLIRRLIRSAQVRHSQLF